VDADLHDPSLHATFGIAQEPGLSELFATDQDSQTTFIASDLIPRLDLLPAGSSSAYSANLFASERMQQLLRTWRTQYDFILIDTPPVCLFTDAVILASLADAVLLVVRSSHTTKHALCRTRDLLLRADARIAGLVLNAADRTYQDSYYFHRYGYLGGASSTQYHGSQSL